MDPQDWLARSMELLAQREQRRLLRRRIVVRPLDATHIEIDGKSFVNFSSNNYLGLTHHPKLLEAIRGVTEAGSGAAGLITGHTELHARAEDSIARWKAMESALLLPSGYQANLAAVGALAGIGEAYSGGVRFLIDKLSHASLIDAVRATGAPMRVFPHNGMDKLARLLREADADQLQVVVSESIFSMDGDATDLAALVNLKREHGFVLLLDEAHGSGVYGSNGAGYAAELGLQQFVDISIVTLSKALGFAGGAVCGPGVFRDAMLNFGRACIYSTSVAPMIAACAQAAIAVMKDEPQRQARVRALAGRVRSELKGAGLAIPEGDSPIVPVILGAEAAVLEASHRLKGAGLWISAVRPPTVPAGSSRLRVTLSCGHSDEEILRLIGAIKGISR